MSLAINATDIAIVSKKPAKLPVSAKRVSRRQFNKLMTQKTRTQKKRWADRSRSNARAMKRSGWEFTEQDRQHEEALEREQFIEDFLAALNCDFVDVDESLTPVDLTPSPSSALIDRRAEEFGRVMEPFWDYSVEVSLETLDFIDYQLYRLSQNQGFSLSGQALQVLGWFMAAFPCPEGMSVNDWIKKLRSEIQFRMNLSLEYED